MRHHIILLSCLAAVGCGGGSFERRLDYGTLSSRAMHGREMEYAVYTPPGFERGERLPLVVFLHGGGDDESSFDRHALGRRLDQATREGRIPRVVILVPDGELGFWANWYDGSNRYEDWVVEDLMPQVAYDYQTLPCPEYCHVMGVSMGGSGTIRFALHRPETFSSATMISAPILDTEQMISLAHNPLLVPIVPMGRIFGPTEIDRVRRDDPFARWTSREELDGLRLMVAWGSADRAGIAETSERLHAHLQQHGVAHEALPFDGNHSWVSWSPVIEEALHRMVPPSQWAIR